MSNLTITIPKELQEEIKRHKEVNWSHVARKAMQEHLERIHLVEKLAAKSKLTEKDAEELDRILKREIAKRHGIKGRK